MQHTWQKIIHFCETSSLQCMQLHTCESLLRQLSDALADSIGEWTHQFTVGQRTAEDVTLQTLCVITRHHTNNYTCHTCQFIICVILLFYSRLSAHLFHKSHPSHATKTNPPHNHHDLFNVFQLFMLIYALISHLLSSVKDSHGSW